MLFRWQIKLDVETLSCANYQTLTLVASYFFFILKSPDADIFPKCSYSVNVE